MIKAVIFDLNEIFLESDFLSGRMEKRYGIHQRSFLPALQEIMEVARRPAAPKVYSLWRSYFKEWKLELSEKEFLDFWFSGEHLNREVVKYAEELRKNNLNVYVLSNNFKERTEYYRQHFSEIFHSVDKAYFSWETGCVKPDQRALELILKENKLKPADCVYFDDSEKNVAAAKKIGIAAYKYASLEATKKIIDKLR